MTHFSSLFLTSPFIESLTKFRYFSQYGQSKSEQKLKSLDFYHHSIKVHTQEAQNLHQLKFPLSDPNLLSKNTSKCEHCETRFTYQKTIFENFMKWCLKGGISIDTDSGPLGYVLWFCGSRSQDFFTFIQIGSGHTVIYSIGLNLRN